MGPIQIQGLLVGANFCASTEGVAPKAMSPSQHQSIMIETEVKKLIEKEAI